MILVVGAIGGALGVLVGAFGAHALGDTLDATALATWQTAVDYQFRHALALLATGILVTRHASRAGTIAAIAFIVGIVLFCGSLYALALGSARIIGMITPFGGLAFIIGWLALALHAWQARTSH